MQGLEQFNAVHPGHPEIDESQVKSAAASRLQCFGAACHRGYVEVAGGQAL